jgi:hypothetical protein
MATKTTTRKKSPSRKATAKKAASKTATKKKPPAKTVSANGKKLSAIDAAAKVLSETGDPMDCRTLVATMASKKYWSSPGGKTPHATLYSAILREIVVKGKDARFKKTERGKFAVNA